MPAADLDALLRRCTFAPPGSAVVCAVSGGADSLALLALACAARLTVTAVHVDHGLRQGSGAEADVVAAAARRLGADFRAVSAIVEPGPNLEARARKARYAAMPRGVLTGHTADDQAETVLLNLLRGAASGLAAMRPGPHRPLLGLRRAETRSLCDDLGLVPLTDPTNTDPAFLRNRVRHELLTMLSELSGRDPVPILCRQADVLRADGDVLDAMAEALDPMEARALAAAEPALARRAIRRWLTDEHPPDLATVERVLAVARGDAVACEVGGGARVQRTGQRLRITHRSKN